MAWVTLVRAISYNLRHLIVFWSIPAGYQRDKEIAHAIDDLDLVVGAHSHSFLWSGSNVPSSETPEGEYPTVIKHASGEQTLVVQAFAYGKYLGKLDLMFDENGRVQHYQGLPIFLDSSFEQGKRLALLFNTNSC